MYISHYLAKALVEQRIAEIERDYTKAQWRLAAEARPKRERRRAPKARAYLAYLRVAKGWSR